MRQNDTIECSRVFIREITLTLNEFNHINVELLISIQTLIFQFSHSLPLLLTLRLGDQCIFVVWLSQAWLLPFSQSQSLHFEGIDEDNHNH